MESSSSALASQGVACALRPAPCALPGRWPKGCLSLSLSLLTRVHALFLYEVLVILQILFSMLHRSLSLSAACGAACVVESVRGPFHCPLARLPESLAAKCPDGLATLPRFALCMPSTARWDAGATPRHATPRHATPRCRVATVRFAPDGGIFFPFF